MSNKNPTQETPSGDIVDDIIRDGKMARDELQLAHARSLIGEFADQAASQTISDRGDLATRADLHPAARRPGGVSRGAQSGRDVVHRSPTPGACARSCGCCRGLGPCRAGVLRGITVGRRREGRGPP